MKPSRIAFEHHWVKTRGKRARNDLKRHPLQSDVYVNDAANRHWVTWKAAKAIDDDYILNLLETSQQAQPKESLTDEQIEKMFKSRWGDGSWHVVGAFYKVGHRDSEAAHGIIKTYPEKDKT